MVEWLARLSQKLEVMSSTPAVVLSLMTAGSDNFEVMLS